MARISSIIEGFTILKKYYDKEGKEYCAAAEHDQLFAYPTTEPMALDDVRAMIALGWCQEVHCDDEDDVCSFDESLYDPEGGWYIFI